MQQRYYDPEIWRFLSANPVTTNLGDPLRLAQPGDACAELDEEGAVTQVTRDAYGKPTAITRRNDAGSVFVTRQYVYDAIQRLCKTIEPETGTTVVAYDPADNVSWSAGGQALPSTAGCERTLVPTSARIARTYDARNRLSTLRFPDGLGDQDWLYTADGLPSQITTWNGANQTLPVVNAYHYNARRMLDGQGESISQPGWYTWALGYGFDRNGHLASHAYPSGLVVDYAPNALGQATKAGTFAANATYHPDGSLAQFTYGNGIVHTMIRNARGLPGQILDLDPATGTRVLDEALDYDQHGNVLAITDGATGRFQRGNRDMAYDGLDRLTSTVSPMFGTATYGHDVLDNLTRVAVTGGPNPRDHWYEYDGSNRLTNVRSGSASGPTVIGLGYDARGNVVNKNGRQFIFGDGNRLHDIAEVEHYRYDGLGRRVLSWAPVVGNILSQYDQAGRLVYQGDYRRQRVVDHVYLGARLVAQRERTLPDGGNLQVSYQHTDALGSAAAATDASRMVTQRSEYEPYGDLLNRGNDDRPGYTGHVMDAETGLTYMQQRYYDPGIGMFLSVDPVTAYSNPVGQFHRYRYANNNPYLFRDPDGRQSCGGGFLPCPPPEAIRDKRFDAADAAVARDAKLIVGGYAASGAVAATGVAAPAAPAATAVTWKVVVRTIRQQGFKRGICLALTLCDPKDAPKQPEVLPPRREPTRDMVDDLRRQERVRGPEKERRDTGEEHAPPPPLPPPGPDPIRATTPGSRQ